MRIESKKYLYDIARAAKLALGVIAGKTFADYSADFAAGNSDPALRI